MEKSKFVFVILHYFTIEDTKKCVESIQNLDNKDIEIVIVDNCSPNKTGKQLEELYKENQSIHVILLNNNLGFANGNNVGFEYAKNKLHADFIVMCNNDTCVLQKDFTKKIIDKYNENKFALLGPKIQLKNNEINKLYLKLPTVNEFKKEIKIFKRNLICNYLGIEDILRKIKKTIIKENSIEKQEQEKIKLEEHKNIILHGCFWIFSPMYINLFDGIDNRTYMYREEELLAIRLLKNNLKSIYYPEIVIYHAEDSSTRAISKTNRKKRRFFYKNQLKSCQIVLEELKKISLGEKYD